MMMTINTTGAADAAAARCLNQYKINLDFKQKRTDVCWYSNSAYRRVCGCPPSLVKWLSPSWGQSVQTEAYLCRKLILSHRVTSARTSAAVKLIPPYHHYNWLLAAAAAVAAVQTAVLQPLSKHTQLRQNSDLLAQLTQGFRYNENNKKSFLTARNGSIFNLLVYNRVLSHFSALSRILSSEVCACLPVCQSLVNQPQPRPRRAWNVTRENHIFGTRQHQQWQRQQHWPTTTGTRLLARTAASTSRCGHQRTRQQQVVRPQSHPRKGSLLCGALHHYHHHQGQQ